MSKPPPSFDIVLRHVSSDARQAGVDLPVEKLTAVNVAQLRALLEALTRLAPKVEYPAVPELRITADGQPYLVQVRDGRVRFSTWSGRAGGCDLTPTQIIAAILGTKEVLVAPPRPAPTNAGAKPARRIGPLVGLAAAAIGCPLLMWLVASPGSDETQLRRLQVLSEYRLLDPDSAKRQLERVAGTYETGTAEGDRRMVIQPAGTVLCAKYGPGRALLEEATLTVVGAEMGGNPALLTGNRSPIEFRGAGALIYFGDTYERVQP